jgi:hypothetical protein
MGFIGQGHLETPRRVLGQDLQDGTGWFSWCFYPVIPANPVWLLGFLNEVLGQDLQDVTGWFSWCFYPVIPVNPVWLLGFLNGFWDRIYRMLQDGFHGVFIPSFL